MKMLVTESQLRNLVKRQRDKRKKEKDVDEAASLTSPSTTNISTGSSSSSTPSSSTTDSGDDIGKSMDAKDYPAYPKVTTWDDIVGSKLTRGKANKSFDNDSHWESGVTREGPANQLT